MESGTEAALVVRDPLNMLTFQKPGRRSEDG